jgi:hypothetical protein
MICARDLLVTLICLGMLPPFYILFLFLSITPEAQKIGVKSSADIFSGSSLIS